MAKKIKKYKVGCDSETYAISLVEAPAIEEDFIALAKQEEEQVFLKKDEKHMVYGAVLVPDKDIYRNDGEREYYISFSTESIERMSQDFMKEYRQHEVTLDHEDTANEVCVVESWIKSDMYKDKSVALGLNQELPVGTWFAGMKVNNIETWERIKSGELKGFSVESMISLEEFSKNDNNMDIKTDDMNFWKKMKEVLAETFSKKEEESVEQHTIEPTNIELEAEPTPAPEPAPEPVSEPQEAPKVEEPVVAPEPVKEEPVEPKNEPVEPQPNPLEELVKNLTEEIKALKTANEGLQEKIKDLGKQPSAAPVNTNAKPSAADTYSAWRETMRKML